MADGTLKVGTITTSSGSGTITLGQSGETVSIPAGTTVSGAGANTPAFMAYLSGNQTVSDGVMTKIAFNVERLDTDSCFDLTTYRFTPTAAGTYVAFCYLEGYSAGASALRAVNIDVYKNGSGYHRVRFDMSNNDGFLMPNFTNVIVEMNGTTDYLEFYGSADGTSGTQYFVGDSDTQTYCGAYRLIGA